MKRHFATLSIYHKTEYYASVFVYYSRIINLFLYFHAYFVRKISEKVKCFVISTLFVPLEMEQVISKWSFHNRGDVRSIRHLPIYEQGKRIRHIIMFVLAHHRIRCKLLHHIPIFSV